MDIFVPGIPITVALAAIAVIGYLFGRRRQPEAYESLYQNIDRHGLLESALGLSYCPEIEAYRGDDVVIREKTVMLVWSKLETRMQWCKTPFSSDIPWTKERILQWLVKEDRDF